MWSYDQSFEPPAPLLDVLVLHPWVPDRSRRVPAKLDTGADLSAIPPTKRSVSIWRNWIRCSRISGIPIEQPQLLWPQWIAGVVPHRHAGRVI